MKNYNEIKNLEFQELKGISQKTIENHHGKLYQGYVKKWQEIQEKLEKTDSSLGNATFSEIRSLKVEESFATNAILLHEAYFDILGGNGILNGEIIKEIEKHFNSFEKWQEEFKSLGLSSRGWVILAYDFNDKKLHNYIADTHNSYGIWGVAPVIVLDMYEHAYFIDFGVDKKSYIETFFQNLDWNKIDKKFQNIIN